MSYDMIDRFLRNNLDDDDYSEYSAALDSLCSPPPANKLTREHVISILRLARELEDSGRMCSLSRGSDYVGQDSGSLIARNRAIQCALQDYLYALADIT